MFWQQVIQIVGHISELTAPQSILICYLEEASFLFMIRYCGSISFSETDNEIPLMIDSSHGVKETRIFITQAYPSDCVSLFPIGSLGLQERT